MCPWKKGWWQVSGSHQEESLYLLAEPVKCTGCRVCEMACSLKHEGACSPLLSRVRVVKLEEWNLNYPAVCAACAQPPCVKACPTQACRPAIGRVGVRVDESQCIGCRECVVACPFGAVGFHSERGVAFICDLCEGDPACVSSCVAGALRFAPPERLPQERRRAKAVAGRDLERTTLTSGL